MASFTSIPKDLNKIKSKVALNMTKRQLICFGTAIVVGVPMYFFTRGTIGNSFAVLLIMVVMSPFFMLAMYEKDGLSAEKVVRNYIRTKFYWAYVRPYKNVSLYNNPTSKEGLNFANTTKNASQTSNRAKQATKQKHSSRKEKSGRTSKRR